MSRRFWIAGAVGVVLGGGVVLGFGPVVRSAVDDKASRYGASVVVDSVVPGWAGVKLSGVDVAIAEIPGVTVHLDAVVVGWGDRRLVSMSGGKISAVGALEDIAAAVDRWRERHLRASGSGAGGGQRLAFDDFEIDWNRGDGVQHARASGLSLVREAGALRVSAEHLEAALPRVEVAVEGGELALRRGEAGYQIEALSSRALTLELRAQGDGADEALTGEDGAAKEDGDAGEGDVAPAVHRRVAAAREARARLAALASRLDGLIAADADIEVGGASAKLVLDRGALNLGPGTLRVAREGDDLRIALAPEVDGAEAGQKALTFSMKVPLSDGETPARDRAIEAELSGGPVWLSMLGVKDGDLGLKDVARTSLEADVKLTIPSDGSRLSIDGHGKVHDLSIDSPRLATEPLVGVELAWRTQLDARLDGSRLDIHDAEVDLGDLRLFVKGSYERHDAGHRVDLRYEVPLITCQRAFESIPAAMLPKLQGMHMAGSLTVKGHAKFDTAALMKSYDVDWDGAMSCRMTDVPAAIDVSNYRSTFRKAVYGPNKEERLQTFGPDEPDWVRLGDISPYMPSAVLCTEDGRFYRHNGFDKEAIINSIRENLKAKRFVRGASTISMQLAKNLYLPRNKTISRKLQEAVLTMYLEQELTKDEMMEMYLNIIEYGPDVYGIGPAAQHYFNRSPSRLSLGQSLYLASILASPHKQYFGSGGAVLPSRMGYLHTLMKILHKIGRISDEELDVGLRETVVFGSSSLVAPPSDDVYDEGDTRQFIDPWSGG